MRVLITGANGYIGSNFVNFISNKTNHELITTGHHELKREKFFNENYNINELKNFNECLFLTKGIDFVFDFASVIGSTEFILRESARILYESTIINLNILEAARINGAKKITFISSASVYPSNLNYKIKEEEAYPINTDNFYGLQKIYIENIYKVYKNKYNMEVYLPRLQGCIGSYIPYYGDKAKGIADIARKIILAKEFDTVKIYGNGKQLRDFMSVDDICEGIYILSQTKFYDPINIASSNPVTFNYLINLILKILNKKIHIERDEKADSGKSYRAGDNSLMKKTLNWSPDISLEEAIEKMLIWIIKDLKI